MFKIENHVPEYYLKESRDFQLFPRLDDVIFLGQHYDISTIDELNNPKKCKNSYLKYLAEKVGFYTDKYISDKVLINIISAFRTAVKNKGTLRGVEQAVIAVLKAENSIDPPRIIITANEVADEWEQYTINIYTPIKIVNEIALREFLKYIIPSGYNYNIYPYDDAKLDGNVIELNGINQINYVITSPSNIGIVRKNINEFSNGNDNYDQFLQDRVIGTADIGIIVAPEDIKFLNTDTNEVINEKPFIIFSHCDYMNIPSGKRIFKYYEEGINQYYEVTNNITPYEGHIYYYCKDNNDETNIETSPYCKNSKNEIKPVESEYNDDWVIITDDHNKAIEFVISNIVLQDTMGQN